MASPYTVTWPVTTLAAQSLNNGAPSQGFSTCTLSLCVCVCVFLFVTFILLFMASLVLQFSSWKPADRFHSHRAWKYLHSQKFVSSYSYCAPPPFHFVALQCMMPPYWYWISWVCVVRMCDNSHVGWGKFCQIILFW